MKKSTLFSLLFFLGGTIAYTIDIYVFRSYQDYLATFSYYGIPEEDYISNAEVANTIFIFKIGIAKYILLGMTAWVTSIFFLQKKIKSNE